MQLPLYAGMRPGPPLIAPCLVTRGLNDARRLGVMLDVWGAAECSARSSCAWVLPRALAVVSIFPPAGGI